MESNLLFNKARTKSEFDIALDFEVVPGNDRVILNTGMGNAQFSTSGGTVYTTNVSPNLTTGSLRSDGAGNSFIKSDNAVPGGIYGKELYVGGFVKPLTSSNGPYAGIFHIGKGNASANGITLITAGLFIAQSTGGGWDIINAPVSMLDPSKYVHVAFAKRIGGLNDQYRLFVEGKVIGTYNRSVESRHYGDDSALLEIGTNHAIGQGIAGFYSNFRVMIGHHVHWDEFNPLDDYL